LERYFAIIIFCNDLNTKFKTSDILDVLKSSFSKNLELNEKDNKKLRSHELGRSIVAARTKLLSGG